jgi:hypothetical protein
MRTIIHALAAIALMATVDPPSSPDPEQALLGRTKAVFEPYDVSSSKLPISGEHALLGKIAGNGGQASAAQSRNRITPEVALLGR